MPRKKTKKTVVVKKTGATRGRSVKSVSRRTKSAASHASRRSSRRASGLALQHDKRKFIFPSTLALVFGVVIVCLKVFMMAWGTCDYIDFEGKLPKIGVRTQAGEIVLEVEVMDTQIKRTQGLKGREGLPETQGMLFLFPKEGWRNFWMKDVKFPIDILFFDRHKRLVGAVEDAQPCVEEPCEYYKSVVVAQYALEVNTGFVAGNFVEVGDVLDFLDDPDLVKWERCSKFVDN